MADKRTCGSCRCRQGGECRCLPPQVVVIKLAVGSEVTAEYPEVSEDFPACGMHIRRKQHEE